MSDYVKVDFVSTLVLPKSRNGGSTSFEAQREPGHAAMKDPLGVMFHCPDGIRYLVPWSYIKGLRFADVAAGSKK